MTKNYGAYKVNYEFNVKPKVSVIFTGNEKDITKNIGLFLEKTYYNNVEFLIPATLESQISLKDNRLKLIKASSINQQAAAASGEFLSFVNSGTVPNNSEWLDELMNLGQRMDVGVVGGKIIDAFDTVLNVGVFINEKDCEVVYEQRGVSNKSIGYYFRPVLPRELFAITEDSLLVRKVDFDNVGGFEEALGTHLMGIDLSRKISLTSKKVIFTPYSELIATTDLFSLKGKRNASKLIEKLSCDQLKDVYKNPNFLG
jgi:hypothetical protein